MKKIISLSAFCTTLFILSGCTTTAQQCDPRIELGMLDKLGCSMSGSYKERIDTKQKELNDTLLTGKALESSLDIAEDEQEAVSKQKATKQAKLAKMNQSINAKLVQVKMLSQGNHQAQSQIKAIEQEMVKLQQSNISDEEKAKEIQRLQQRVSKLQQSLK